ncbi:MAG: gliding motility-associated C-terminal domain-containing protein, partial [Cyclobacteriaceae bacterium]|nr:gliding motility-associated C-terminal domain-containing protein [Cyclobacteriaceae bacterium]
ITQLSSKRYWELSALNGSLGNTIITLPLRDEENLSGASGLFAVGESEVALGPYQSLGQSAFVGDPVNGTVGSESSPTRSFFTVVVLSGEKNVIVYNGVSPNGDGYNDYFQIFNIDHYPSNTVSIYNRWGDKVFEVNGYDNDQKVFKGENNTTGNGKLSSGVYFYKILLGDGSKELTGYLELKN